MNIATLKQVVLLRKRSFIAVGLLFISALALQVLINLYQLPKVERLQAEWMQLREQEGRGAALQDRETLYRNGLADLAKFRGKIYPKSQFARFIGELYDMAGKSNLELASITYKPTLAKEDQLLSYALTLTVNGSYAQVKRFIYDLGSGGSNILTIDSIAMTAGGSTAEAVQLQLTISSWFKMEAQ